jgi:hypothetical protein
MLHVLTFSAVVATAAPVSNQAALATKLAQAVASGHGDASAKVYVGALPPGVKIAAPLPQFTLLGSVVKTPSVSDGFSARNQTVVYYELPANAQGALDAYQRRLTAAGWKHSVFFKRFQAVVSPNGGFAVTRPNPEMPDMYCNASTILSTTRLRSMPNVLELSYGGGMEGASLCAVSAAMNAMPTPPPPPALPTLKAPANVTMEPSSRFTGAFSSGTAQSDAAITSSLPLAKIGSDFAGQLTAAGWTADGAAQSATTYAQTFRMTSNKGRHLFAVLTLLSTGQLQHYLATVKAVDLDARSSQEPGFSFPF